MKRKLVCIFFMTLFSLIQSVPVNAEYINFTASFTINGLEPQWATQWWDEPEPIPTETIVGGFTYLWDDTSGFSTAELLSFTADFGLYTANWNDIGYLFQDNGEFRIANETISGINGLRNNTNDYYFNGNVFNKTMYTVAYSFAGQDALTSYWTQENQSFFVSDGTPYEDPNGPVLTPEPATSILLGIGLVILLMLARSRQYEKTDNTKILKTI